MPGPAETRMSLQRRTGVLGKAPRRAQPSDGRFRSQDLFEGEVDMSVPTWCGDADPKWGFE